MKGNRVCKDFPLLPTQISIDPIEDFRLEMWRDRTHPGIETQDLLLRMRPGPSETCLSQVTMNQRCIRIRKKLGIICWTRQTKAPSTGDCLLLERISPESIKRNTVLPVTSQGLLKPSIAPNGSLVNSNYIPLNTFTNNDDDHIPSSRLRSHLDIITTLQTKAFELGYPHWIFLPNKHKPEAWSKKAAKQGQARRKAGQHSEERSAPDEVRVPAIADITPAALEHIKSCVRFAAACGNALDTGALPNDTKVWVEQCIREGQTSLNVPGDINIEGSGGQGECGMSYSVDEETLENMAQGNYYEPSMMRYQDPVQLVRVRPECFKGFTDLFRHINIVNQTSHRTARHCSSVQRRRLIRNFWEVIQYL